MYSAQVFINECVLLIHQFDVTTLIFTTTSNMEKFKMLSGEQLVTLGAKKASVSLPEIGLKEVFPNGSWLEKKQIQNALEARKYLIEVERIDKLGTLSIAHWREDVKLAEVSQRCGGHWQYLGHTVGKQWFIRPEETLLLMEMNCLQLKNNGVIVSIQQAYSLLLRDTISLVQYKVYASLSRLGYKVFRHDTSRTYSTVNKESEDMSNDSNEEQETDITETTQKTDIEIERSDVQNVTDMDVNTELEESTPKGQNSTLNDIERVLMEVDKTNENNLEVSSSVNFDHESKKKPEEVVSAEICNGDSMDFIERRLKILYSREVKPCRSQVVHETFKENLPDLYQKTIVTLKAPEEQHIPRNVFLNNTAYVLNLEKVRVKNVNPSRPSSSRTYSNSDDVNEEHVRRIRSSVPNERPQSNWVPQFFSNIRIPQQTNHFRQFNYWTQYNFNVAFQRPFFPGMSLRYPVFPRMQPMFRSFHSPHVSTPNSNVTGPDRPQKRKMHPTQKYHLDSIKKLAAKLRSLVRSGNTQVQNIQSLQRLVNTYNTRYSAKLQLNNALEIIENEVVLETIELDDDEQVRPKKKKTSDGNDTYKENFESLKNIAMKIMNLEEKHECSSRHRRALSHAIVAFNKSYDADIYINSHYEVLDRRQIVITSSDSEDASEAAPKPKKGKKLRNPFNILKQLAEKQSVIANNDNSNKTSGINRDGSVRNGKYSEMLINTFSKDWLPDEDDFGRAEVVYRNTMNNQLMDDCGNFIYDFMSANSYDNWLEAKISYWQSCKESNRKFQVKSQNEEAFRLDSIITSEDCTDLKSVLSKLSIIKTNKGVKDECSLNIDFDVYNRDVQNFRKSNKPKPHFRIICIEESCRFPSGLDLATLQLKYNDGIANVFAVVGIASISYLQVNPSDLPVYIPTCNLP